LSVGDHHPRRTALPFQKLSHQTLCGFGIAVTLHQNVKNETILIDGAPGPVFLAGNRDDDLVKVPFVAEFTGRAPADVVCEMPTEFLGPKFHGLVRNDDATRCRHILDHS
jgi:hypothetical protein